MARLPNIVSAGVLGILAIQLGACARYARYQPAPLMVTDEAGAYAARRLDDPGLARVLAAHGVATNDTAWDSRPLALAALYFRPALTEAQRSLEAARAGEISARTRPYPSASVVASRAGRASEGRSTPWSVSLATGLTLELGGKRDARIARARAGTLAARLRLESAAWRIAQEARASGTAAVGSDADLADARGELAQLRTLLDLLRGRFREGRIVRAELARSETDVQTSAVAATLALRARSDARAALARALAVPIREADRIPLRPDPRSACVVSDSLPIDTLDVLALWTHPLVGVALADYTVTEADLRGRIAQQYPDLVVGPGLAWDQGIGRWILSLALPGIPIDRARGPIAEAVARRAVQAARVTVVQDSVLAAVDSGVAACHSGAREVAVADSLVRSSAEQLRLTQAAYQRGETGQTETAFARLALIRAERARHQASQRTMAAGVALETATGVWLSGAPVDWRDLIAPDDSASPDASRERARVRSEP